MLNIIITALTLIFSIAGLVVAAWSYSDTKRKYSHQEYLNEIEQDNKEADKRFKERTRLGKRD
ncbi:hypothetical protein [Vibrio echinoideorum]|uniref:hypothetical protein n=1 Tax=Vibrio echinoideorum TaxID=2100116 RepID=UPI003554226B